MSQKSAASRIRRRSKAASLSLLAAGLPLVVDRLLILPWFASMVASATFGETIWLLGFAQIGASLCGTPYSFALAQNRHHSSLNFSRRAAQDSLVLIFLGVLLWTSFYGGKNLNFFGPLVILLVARTAAFPLETALRISNKLGTILLNRIGEFLSLGLIVIVMAPTSPERLLWTLAIGSSSYFALTLVSARIFGANYTAFDGTRPQNLGSYRWTAAGSVLLPQSPRLMLGVVASSVSVSIFFATWSLIGLLNRPISVISNLILAKLSREHDPAIEQERRRTLAILSLAVWVGAMIVALAIGKLLVPNVYNQELQLGNWGLAALSLGAAGQTSALILRPFLLRFGHSTNVAKATWTAITIQLVLLAILGFVWGATGAAVAVAIGANTLLLLYFRESFRQP